MGVIIAMAAFTGSLIVMMAGVAFAPTAARLFCRFSAMTGLFREFAIKWAIKTRDVNNTFNPRRPSESTRESITRLLMKQVLSEKPDKAQKVFTRVLRTAINESDEWEMNYLLRHGADPCAIDKKGRSILHLAAGHHITPDTLTLILDGGAKINARDKKGNTPLHVAAQSCCDGVVEMLIKRGAKTSVKNHAGQTPLDIALKLREETECDVGDGVVSTVRLLTKHTKTGASKRRLAKQIKEELGETTKKIAEETEYIQEGHERLKHARHPDTLTMSELERVSKKKTDWIDQRGYSKSDLRQAENDVAELQKQFEQANELNALLSDETEPEDSSDAGMTTPTPAP